MTLELQAEGGRVSRRRVANRIRALDLRAKTARKFKATTTSKHALPVALNLLNQDFTASAPNRVWVSEITAIWTGEDWLYLAVVLDVYSRTLVGWAMDAHITRELVAAARPPWSGRRRPGRGLIAHSDGAANKLPAITEPFCDFMASGAA